MGSRCGLADLPKDVFIHCILPHITKKRDLAALRATATGFNELITPELFREYVNITEGVEVKKSFVPFLRIIAARPDLARHCKSIEVREFSTRTLANRDDMEYYKWNPWGRLSIQDYNLFARAAMDAEIVHQAGRRSNNPADKQFLNGLLAGDEDAQLSLIFACLPNLEKITLHGFPSPPFRSMQWNTVLGSTKHGFSRLAEFSAVSCNGRAMERLTWSFDELDFLLRLPRFRKFHAERILLNDRNPLWDSLPATSSLKSLRLHSCELGSKAANALLRSCTALETFEYSWGRGAGTDLTEVESLYAAEIREALSEHKHSLRTLYLDFRDYEHWEEIGQDWVGSFKEFSKLARLGIDYARLVGKGSNNEKHDLSAILPNAIELLSLDYAFDEEWGHEVCSDLIRLAQTGLDACPRLTVVALPEKNFRIRGPEWTEVKSVCESRGLQMRECDWADEAEPLARRQDELNQQERNLLEPEQLEWTCRWAWGRWPSGERDW